MNRILALIFSLSIAGVVSAQQLDSTLLNPTRNPDYYNTLLSNVPLPHHDQNWNAVEETFGRKGVTQGDVFKISFPRSDLKVKLGSVMIEPGLALTAWLAFRPMGNETMMMGDLVLLENEIAPAMGKLLENGLDVSAIHNHIVGESPKVMYMHVGGHGDAEKLAAAMKIVLQQTKTPLGPVSAKTKSTAEIDWGNVESILGHQGKHSGKLLQFGIPRVETLRDDDMEIPPFMGMATGINMQMEGKKAATTGDFVLLVDEVSPVMHALIENGIAVTALHNHMLRETPRLFFMHFWGYDEPEKLARGLRAALDKINSAKAK